MPVTYKSLRYSTAIAVSLVALSTANQAYAQCAPAPTGGNDTITCSGTQVGGIDLLGGNDSLTNNGIVQGSIESTAGSDTVINSAGSLIQTTGTTSVDVGVRYINVIGDSIYNAGTIESAVRAIRLQNNSDLTGGFLNDTTGVIIGDASNVNNGFHDNAAVDIVGGDISGGFENRGSIRHNSRSGLSFNGSTDTITGAIVNSGIISGGQGGFVLTGFDLDLSAGIDNSGTFSGDAGNGIAVVSSSSDISGGITNRSGGVISGGTSGILVGSSANDISGGVMNEAGGVISGNVGISVGGGNSISGGIDNAGNIEGTGGTAINLTNLSAATPITISGGRIIGDVTDSNITSGRSPVTVTSTGFKTEGDFTVSDLIVNAGQDLTISAYNIVTLNNMTASTGTIIFELAPASAAQLNVNGAGNDIDISTSIVEVLSNGRSLVDGESILIGTGVTALNGGGGQALTDVTDNSLFFDFQLADGLTGGVGTNNELYLLVSDASNPCAGLTSNSNSSCQVLGDLIGTTNSELSKIISNADEKTLAAILPEINGGSLAAAQNVTGNTIRLVSDRLTVIRDSSGGASGISSGHLAENLQMWGQVFGQKVKQGLRDGVVGFDSYTRGVTVGADTEDFHDNATVGVALSYANTDVDLDNATNTQSGIDSYNITLYGDYDLAKDTYLIGDIGYTYGDNKTTRYNVGGVSGLNAHSDYGSHQMQLRGILAKDYHPTKYEGLRVTPKALVKYTYYQNENIEETGAGGANLNVDSEALNIFEVGVGLDVRKDYVQDNGGIISPEISAGYRYDLVGDAVQTTSTFEGGGPSFRSEGANPDQDTLNFGLGVGYTSPNSTELTVSYDYESKDEFDSHSAYIRLAAPF